MPCRRLSLAGLAVAATVAGAAAQQAPAVAPIPANPQPTGPSRTETVPGGVTPEQQQRLRVPGAPQDTGVGPQIAAPPAQAAAQRAGAQYVREMLAAGTVSLQESTFARTKAHHPRVKRFAAFEEAEQAVLAEILRSLSEPGATASVSPGAAGAAATAPVLSSEAAAVMERFSRAAAGPAFDRDYVAAQIAGHRQLIALQERHLQGGAQSSELRIIATLARSRAQEHLAELEAIRDELPR